ncbi:MAG TPA: hypothetical protein VM575_05835 [Nocardioides sp.]|nr:hypothetical protein [Nocardioides sp.]
MRAPIRGLVVALCATFLLVPTGGPARAADSPVIVVPEGTWSGVETVTVTTDDPAVLSVVVEIGAGPIQRITVREPVTEPGTPVELDVPTWGIDGLSFGVVRLCTSLDAPCYGQALSFTRTITQEPADAVTADLEIPANPVFLPEEDSWITVHNPGGGKLYVRGTGMTPVAAGERVKIAWPLSQDDPFDLEAARCTDGFTPTYYGQVISEHCERFDLGRRVALLRDLWFEAATEDDHRWVVTDPTAPYGTSLPVSVTVGVDVVQTLSYRLLDANGGVVLGPVDWAPAVDPTTGSRTRTLDFDPTVLNGGVPLPDGDYDLEITSAVVKGGLERASTKSFALHLDDDLPPAEDLPGYGLSTIQRDVRGGSPAYISVGGTNDPRYLGTLHVTDAAGNEVWADTTGPDCRGDSCQFEPDPNDAAWYDFSWPGTTTAGAKLPAGEYHAVMTVVDTWGRTVEVADVGSLWIDHLETVTTTKRYTPADTTWAYSTIGRCSSSPKPGPHGWPGSVAVLSLSRCRSTAGKADWAFRTFFFTLRGAPGQQRLLSYRVGAYGAPVRRGMRGSIVYDVSGLFEEVQWRGAGVLSGGLGWHDAARQAPTADTADRFFAAVQARTTNGNKWDVRYWRVSWTYRAWRR